jgi:glycosyltransferase involved in cell wall biosynthesis
MANQTRQLARLLGTEGMAVETVQTNVPYKPGWVENLHGIRALFRLFPYLWQLWQVAGRVDLLHVMANSGWSWHLFAAPAIWVGWLRRTPVVVNYRGGEAESFFQKSFRWVRPSLKRVAAVVVPSGFLADVFNRRGIDVHIVRNIVDVQRFTPSGVPAQHRSGDPHLLVTRNLEPIYDIATALRAFRRIYDACPGASLTVCGSGPERESLLAVAEELGLGGAVTFTGRLDNDRIAGLYQSADVLMNPSLADNMPISILEALASGVAVVSTDVGGVPYLVSHEKTALLVSPGDDRAMAGAVISLLENPALRERMVKTGQEEIHDYTWPRVRGELLAVYSSVLRDAVGSKREQQDAH